MKTRREHIFYAFYNHTGMARHLEKMAARGWMLDRITTNGSWRYHAIAPAQVHFAVAYFPTASDFDAAPNEDLQHFLDLCEAAGWELVARTFQMMIFCNCAENPVPLETDPAIQVENIHTAMWSSYMWGKILALGLGGYWLLKVLNDLDNSPAKTLSWYLPLLLTAMALLLIFHQGAELIFYYRWHSKAERIAKEENRFLPVSGSRMRDVVFYVALAVLLAAYAILENWRIALACCLFSGALLVLYRVAYAVRDAMKRRGVSRMRNRVLSFLLLYLLVFGLRYMEWSNMDWIVGDPHAKAEYTWQDRTYTAYCDTLPLTVEDFLPDADNSHYSNYLYHQGTPLAAITSGVQYLRTGYYATENQPDEFYYHVFRSDLDIVLEDGARWRRAEMAFDFLKVAPMDSHLIDPAPYGAVTAWKNGMNYLLRYEDRVIQLSFSWYPTDDQLGQCITTLRSLSERSLL